MPSRHRGDTLRVTFRPRLSRAVVLFLLTLLTIAVQGYHYGVDDAAIYLPAVERFVTPGLFPYGADFFLFHSRVSFFSDAVGSMVRWLHVPLPWAVLVFHVLGIPQDLHFKDPSGRPVPMIEGGKPISELV